MAGGGSVRSVTTVQWGTTDGEIIEFYTDLLRSDARAYNMATERCCHQGAAEFLMPQASVRETIASEGFSVDLVDLVAERYGTSIIASAIQIARCAPVDCYVVICASGLAPRSSPPHHGLFVEYAAAPLRVKYTLGRFSPVHADNLLAHAWKGRNRVRGYSYVPFRSAAHKPLKGRMECHCDAKRLGDRVLGILSLEALVSPDQLTLSFDNP